MGDKTHGIPLVVPYVFRSQNLGPIDKAITVWGI